MGGEYMIHAVETWHFMWTFVSHRGVDLLCLARSEYDSEDPPMSPNRWVHELYLAKLEYLGQVGTSSNGFPEFGLMKNYTSPCLILF